MTKRLACEKASQPVGIGVCLFLAAITFVKRKECERQAELVAREFRFYLLLFWQEGIEDPMLPQTRSSSKRSVVLILLWAWVPPVLLQGTHWGWSAPPTQEPAIPISKAPVPNPTKWCPPNRTQPLQCCCTCLPPTPILLPLISQLCKNFPSF